jgi:hypothetical protein
VSFVVRSAAMNAVRNLLKLTRQALAFALCCSAFLTVFPNLLSGRGPAFALKIPLLAYGNANIFMVYGPGFAFGLAVWLAYRLILSVFKQPDPLPRVCNLG